MAADTRDRMIEATVSALQHHGVAGMSFTDVLRDSGAARGAIYHHFPGGKLQLVGQAAQLNGRQVRQALAGLPAENPAAVVSAFLELVRPVVQASAAGGGCAVAAVTVGSGLESGETELRQIADSAFSGWADELTERLRASGLESDRARDLATTLIVLLEGAHVLCRASGTIEPFERAARTATSLAP
ncbi:MAG TPA: TetR/AcrR family transcriptional regulator [Actinocrinis sp.]|nr:TetR/AcrR family transcriptional regulator [Actinocrinis sp.]